MMRNPSLAQGMLIAALLPLGSRGVAGQDWPQWRGPHRDNKVVGFVAPTTWPAALSQKWKVAVGTGEASPLLVGNRLYVFGRLGGEEVTQCLDAATGKALWQDRYAAVTVNGAAGQHPGPRSTPAVAEGKLCTLGVGGVLSCLDTATGKVVWRKDSMAWPRFYTSSSPIIEAGKCIAYLGGQGNGAVTAFDLNTGEEKWKWSGEGPSYGSPVLMTVAGTTQLVTLGERSLLGLSVADGKLLWQTALAAGRYNTGTPIVDGATVICAGQAFKVEKQGDAFTVKDLWKGQAPHQYNTPVLKDGMLYGLTGRTNFYCASAQTGEVIWTDMAQRGECGAVFDAGTVLLALTSNGELVAFKPGTKEYTELAKIKVAETPPWAYPVIAGKRVFVKDRDAVTLWTFE